MVVRTKATRLSVTIDPELKAEADEIAKMRGITTSRLVSECLLDMLRKRKRKLLIEYYRTMAAEHDEFAKNTAELVNEVASSWVKEDA